MRRPNHPTGATAQIYKVLRVVEYLQAKTTHGDEAKVRVGMPCQGPRQLTKRLHH